ncbi:MAG: alanine racemase, partial [Clostridiaceae bacterium]|nr:alanine racemase [Clostridiaceae bacterium]
MKSYSRVYAEIDLDAVIKNMESMRANLTPDTAMIGVVKTDGYGHGSVPVAKAIDPFVTGYAVATVEEGILLRRHGITKMVLILGSVHESQFEELITYKLFPPVFQLEKAEKLSKLAVSMNERAGIHIALDTGMSRIGFPVNKESAEAVAAISRLPGIRIEGMFTHFAKADETDKSSARRQLCAYEQMMEMLGG